MERQWEILKTLTGFSEEDLVRLRRHADRSLDWAAEAVRTVEDLLAPCRRRQEECRDALEAVRLWYLEVASGQASPQVWFRRGRVEELEPLVGRLGVPAALAVLSRLQQLFLHQVLRDLPVEEARELYLAFHRVSSVALGLLAHWGVRKGRPSPEREGPEGPGTEG